jgi:hypothetical protein
VRPQSDTDGSVTDADLLDFARFWAVHPRRRGTDSRAAAEKAWKARRRSGVPAETILAGAARYKAHCEREGIIGTPYVMAGSRFVGTERNYEQPWSADADGSDTTTTIPGARNADDVRRLKAAGY